MTTDRPAFNIGTFISENSGLISAYLNALKEYGLTDQFLYTVWHLNPFLLFQLISKEFIPHRNLYDRLSRRSMAYISEYEKIDFLFKRLEGNVLPFSALCLSTVIVNLCKFLSDNKNQNRSWARKLLFSLEFSSTYDDYLNFVEDNDVYYRQKGTFINMEFYTLF